MQLSYPNNFLISLFFHKQFIPRNGKSKFYATSTLVISYPNSGFMLWNQLSAEPVPWVAVSMNQSWNVHFISVVWDIYRSVLTGYYSYLYAKCFSATIWEKLCQEDPLSRNTGTALRTKFLQHGGSKEAVDLLTDLVGDGIVRYCDGGVIPDITSLCKEMDLSGSL